MKALTVFFGDNTYEFKLTAALIIELERAAGAGIGTICNRVFAKHFTQNDIHETIRLSLIGAGMAPKRSQELLAAYVVDRPLIETYPLACRILEALWVGEPHQ